MNYFVSRKHQNQQEMASSPTISGGYVVSCSFIPFYLFNYIYVIQFEFDSSCTKINLSILELRRNFNSDICAVPLRTNGFTSRSDA